MEEINEKKERVMHTRIPESLVKQLKTKAQGLGVSVSNLVRNVLVNTFDLVDDIVSDSADIARIAKNERLDNNNFDNNKAPNESILSPGTAPEQEPVTHEPVVQESAVQEPVIVGWQPLVLNLNAICYSCNDIMPKGIGYV